MIINKSKFKTKIGVVYYLWESSSNNTANLVFLGNNRKSFLEYLKKLKDVVRRKRCDLEEFENALCGKKYKECNFKINRPEYLKKSKNRRLEREFEKQCKKKNHKEDILVIRERKSSEVENIIKNYLNGKVKNFDLKIKFLAGTEFERKVWSKTTSIPYGKTVSYKNLAQLVGHLGANRAVGTALAKNPIMLIVPCHRVIRSDGSIGRYSGGENIKKFLLEMENI